jgi:hypothetical protein
LKLPYTICCVAFEPKPWKSNTTGTFLVPAYVGGT